MTRLRLLPPEPEQTDAGGRNVRLLSILRLLAICGQLATILFVHVVMGVSLPLMPMLAALAVLATLNLAIGNIAARRTIDDTALFATLLVDAACLSVQLYLSGGVANPFVTLYLLQVVIAAVLLPVWSGWAMVALTSALFALLATTPYHLPVGVGATLSAPFRIAAWFSFTLAASLHVLFVTRIVRNLAEREARLATLRQRAAEEEHIVRMGLLASGAAHELGTPLASLAVMLGDWRRDPMVRSDRGLLGDVEAMSGEVARCKDILTQVLLASGEVRGQAPVRTTLRQFLDENVARWQASNEASVRIEDRIGRDVPMIADGPLAQTIINLLDNAVEAGAAAITVILATEGAMVRVSFRDDGRGFDPAVLEDFGKPYRTTKARHGAGLGLFLATNVLRLLGGTVTARNPDQGGGEVTLAWPRAAIAPETA